jgi:hypothetical protein
MSSSKTAVDRKSELSALQRDALALTFRYQKRFPEVVDGERKLGRIKIEKRGEFINNLSKLLITDDKLRLIAMERTDTSDSGVRLDLFATKVDRIAARCMEKTGHVDRAIAELEAIERRLHWPGNGLFESGDIDRLAKLQGLTPDQRDKFWIELSHMTVTAMAVLVQPFRQALKKLERSV